MSIALDYSRLTGVRPEMLLNAYDWEILSHLNYHHNNCQNHIASEFPDTAATAGRQIRNSFPYLWHMKCEATIEAAFLRLVKFHDTHFHTFWHQKSGMLHMRQILQMV